MCRKYNYPKFVFTEIYKGNVFNLSLLLCIVILCIQMNATYSCSLKKIAWFNHYCIKNIYKMQICIQKYWKIESLIWTTIAHLICKYCYEVRKWESTTKYAHTFLQTFTRLIFYYNVFYKYLLFSIDCNVWGKVCSNILSVAYIMTYRSDITLSTTVLLKIILANIFICKM